MNKKHLKVKRNILPILVLFLFGFLFLFSFVKIVFSMIDNHKSKNILDRIDYKVIDIDEKVNTTLGYFIDFNKLKLVNSDVVGYLQVNGTDIDYPVVQAKNNTYYLNHSFDKSFNAAGWVFLNSLNRLDGTDKNLSFFAHARVDGSMFGSLKNTLKKKWQDDEKNREIVFITKDGVSIYRVFSTYKIKSEDYYLQTEFEDDAIYLQFLEKILERSNYDYGEKIDIHSQILTLSTCSFSNQYRIVLHAKLVKSVV